MKKRTIEPKTVTFFLNIGLFLVAAGCSNSSDGSNETRATGGISSIDGNQTSTGGSSIGGNQTSTGGSAIGGNQTSTGGSAIGGSGISTVNTSTSSSSPTFTTINYAADTSTVFANPERGFYHHEETHAGNHVALDANQLRQYRTEESITLILRMFYVESFRNSDISAAYLDAISADLTAVRTAGLKAILRFAYTDSMTAPYGDASRTRVLGHIAQLAPIINQNADVILTVQAGFIGTWGEWYYTDYFGDQGQISDTQWDDRRAVVDAWLMALPDTKSVQLRTPAFKQHFFGATALTTAEAFTTTSKARVGHHNDCFLASADDQGTYANVKTDKAYLATENLYVPQGGETCEVSPYSDWTHAASDLRTLHYTYLNRDYQETVLGGWGSNLDEARRLLGYRLSLTKGTYANSASAGGVFTVSLTLTNNGYAPPIGPRAFDLLLRHETTKALYRAQLAVDLRRFVPGTEQVINETICVPSSVASGKYHLLLALPDQASTLRTQAAYAIRLANAQLWEESTGYHDLMHIVRINAETTTDKCPAGEVTLVAE
jgi:hypothetical protein